MNKLPNKFNTNAVRAGINMTEEGEHSEAMFLTSSFVFENAQQASDRFKNVEKGNVYSRFTNPTVRVFEERLASLEEAEQCVATSSGMSAILSLFMSLCQPGDHIVVSRSIFGTTVQLFNNILKRWGIDISYVDLKEDLEWKAAITNKTKFFFVETPSNPLTELCNIKDLASIAHEANIKLVVDNCFCTPALQKPLLHGADIIIHSATKYLDGQGRCLGGAVLGSKEDMTEVYGFLRTAGPTLSAFNAWVFTKSLETLNIRMQAHSSNAMLLATWLEKQKKVTKVYYPGLESHPQYALANTQQSSPGGVLSFEVKGGMSEAWSLIDSTKLLSITANLGDVKTTITHPTTTTHSRLSDQERIEVGINDNLVRIAVGLEDIDDIIGDLNYLLK
ncbi:O-succinylhomoserine sulfhydrylase [Methylophilaceae bacterium]|jgi:O-succinylhomoserine sulfhydrylase|nr:O-succinylhomoserine sulfhydrylase [Nitrosomonadales bacterium]MCH9781921.1 O-succinylhomoserine sulfhydrylase [Betaproteobacteria bacterium]MDA9096810.1 O-succinylhomoserine sulfhydrylase [Methylophilaceae bacterium]MBT5411009.1 O-succinylhomoserine sulfhydrylase [Nitrosomonadales bacterium]MDC0114770.1 O-succinylhomoserine sulfhydrylase [Methylophilaceae bacterium]|tara:strand:- start:35030 stop:36202 length:1173 start_codon:yes stop_codon:yes gene_type:complete